MIIEVMQVEDLILHDLASSTPRMVEEQYEALKKSIDEQGQLEPVTLYRGKIIDGRHRWLILQELDITDIKVVKLANNTTLAQLKEIVRGKETRRHESAAQLAISAYYYMLESKEKISQVDAAAKFGANRKRIGEAKKIDVIYGRPDILELLFDGGSFNTGTVNVPFYTDSLGTILNWLAENGTINTPDKDIGIKPRTELLEAEQLIVNKFINAISKESIAVQEEIARVVYAKVKGE